MSTTTTRYGASLRESIDGLFAILFALLTPFLRRSRTQWGATDEELSRTYPGDELVPTPKWDASHAITIQAKASDIWPWLVQIGQGRGGFYSYQKLENLAGCNIQNSDCILPEFQSLQVGDPIKLHPETPPLKVVAMEPEQFILIEGSPVGSEEGEYPTVDIRSTWLFFLEEHSDGSTRLISRTRYSHGPGLRNALMGGPLLIEPISFVMEQKMLRVLRALAESPKNI